MFSLAHMMTTTYFKVYTLIRCAYPVRSGFECAHFVSKATWVGYSDRSSLHEDLVASWQGVHHDRNGSQRGVWGKFEYNRISGTHIIIRPPSTARSNHPPVERTN